MEPTNRDLYKQAGVDVDKGDHLVAWLQNDESKLENSLGSVVSGIGGFSALFRPNFSTMEDPLIISGTDGVGTKVLLGIEQDKLEGLGGDLVGMCVNDLYTIGGRPLFFLDYFATGQLSDEQFKSILSGIKKALKQCKTYLMGGETAELPGLYAKGHFDLAGFVVGVVDGKKQLGPHLIEGDEILYGIPSSGFHSNGYSLLRKWFSENPKMQVYVERLLEPTRLYPEIPDLLDQLGCETLRACAHITGGGISGNLPRVLPKHICAKIDKKKIPTPDWMQEIFSLNDASFEQVEGVFNLGLGMVCAVAKDRKEDFERVSASMGLQVVEIGSLEKTSEEPTWVSYH